MKKKYILILISVIACGIMAVIDGIFKIDYFSKSIIKIFIFTSGPVLYQMYDKKADIKSFMKPAGFNMLTSFGLGAAVYVIILGGYFALRNVFDFSEVAGSLTRNIGVNKENFVFVALYISLVNSLLEEFFFRGFIYMTLAKMAEEKLAHIVSSGLFAVYHIAMMADWFSPMIFCVVLPGLFAGGIIFNYLNVKNKNIYSSWFVHMFANFAINTIGFILFDII